MLAGAKSDDNGEHFVTLIFSHIVRTGYFNIFLCVFRLYVYLLLLSHSATLVFHVSKFGHSCPRIRFAFGIIYGKCFSAYYPYYGSFPAMFA